MLVQLFFAEKLKFWKVSEPSFKIMLSNRYWDVELEPVYTSRLPESDDFGKNTCCFATSYVTCRAHQKIDLSKKGFSGRILDKFQPSINVSEW